MASTRKAFIKDLNDKSVKELVQLRAKLQKELHGLKMKHAIKGLQKTHEITLARKNIARINTLLTSKIKEQYGNTMK